VSSTALGRKLKELGIDDPRPVVFELTSFDPETSRETGRPQPNFKFYHSGRSFLSEERLPEENAKQEDAAGNAEAAVANDAPSPLEEAPASRTNRREEARLVTYVQTALEGLYESDFAPEERDYVFDVHSARPGSSFENVDLLAVHWLPRNICEFITVEVKLEFNVQVIHQAINYTCFSHRTWVAVPVATNTNSELRTLNPSLFDYAISRGLGILACRRRQGRSYDVFPVHWPVRHQPGILETEEFLERHRAEFEKAGVLRPARELQLPRF
jgi:hypothetical protein